jgi:hypothetical protein
MLRAMFGGALDVVGRAGGHRVRAEDQLLGDAPAEQLAIWLSSRRLL